MHTIRITTSQNIDIDYEAASVGDRILGHLIDMGIFILIYAMIIIFGLMGMDGFGNVGFGIPIVMIIMVLVYAFYDLVLEIFMNGQSVGKRVMKIRVISLDGGRPTIGQYLIRWVLRIVDFSIGAGVIALVAVIVTDKKQRVGDIAAGTTLVKTEPRTTATNLVFAPPPEDYTPTYSQVNLLSDADINLIHEVIANYLKSGNTTLLYSMAKKVKDHLGVTTPWDMSDFTFLQTVLKDYTKMVAGQGQ